MVDISGLDVSRSTRIKLEYDKNKRTIVAKFSSEFTETEAVSDVEHYISSMKQRLGYAEAWLKTHKKDVSA